MEYYIYNIPLFLIGNTPPVVDIPQFCTEVEERIPQELCSNLDVVYVGEIPELNGRNALYSNGAIYMSSTEPTTFDMLENFVHELAHSLEVTYGSCIYTDDLIQEFKGKRATLYQILKAKGYDVSERLFDFTEYTEKFDHFLADEVGYPTLLSLTMGLFASPYAATSIQEYYANGFEKYYLDNPGRVRIISPVLYEKIVEILNDNT
jgi:hypothetical protein